MLTIINTLPYSAVESDANRLPELWVLAFRAGCEMKKEIMVNIYTTISRVRSIGSIVDHTTVTLMQGVSLRTNLNMDSTKLAGVDSSHTSNSPTIQFCRVFMSLKVRQYEYQQNENIFEEQMHPVF